MSPITAMIRAGWTVSYEAGAYVARRGRIEFRMTTLVFVAMSEGPAA